MSSLAPGLKSALHEAVGAKFVLTDPAMLLAYESDALTLFRCKPGAVVLPENCEQVMVCVKALHAARVPFAARGAGTGLSGGALVPEGGVILAMTRMKRVLEIDPEGSWAVVEPGLVNAELGRQIAPLGLRYAPDPASQTVSTLGGNLAENAGGPQCFLHGTTAQHILGATVVLADGRIERWGGCTAFSDDLDLRGFLTGSEGTVGIVVEITVRLIPLPQAVATLCAAFDSIATACAAVSQIVAEGLQPVALEVMDQTTIRAVEASVYRAGLPTEAGAVLIVEMEGASEKVARETGQVEDILQQHHPIRVETAQDDVQRAAIWKGRKGAGGALGQIAPDSYVMDGVVPRSRLADIMAYVDEVEAEFDFPIANLFHAGDGNIHPHFSYDGRDPAQVEVVEQAGAKILRKCLEMGGSITGEHGIGLEKQHLLAEQFSAAELDLMTRLRQVFNPDDLLNPGKGLPMKRGCAEAFHRHRGGQHANLAEAPTS
jgi:glycolate dehydrogenase FAD-linked subunit